MDTDNEYSLEEVVDQVAKATGSQIGGLEDKKYNKDEVDEIISAIQKNHKMAEKDFNQSH